MGNLIVGGILRNKEMPVSCLSCMFLCRSSCTKSNLSEGSVISNSAENKSLKKCDLFFKSIRSLWTIQDGHRYWKVQLNLLDMHQATILRIPVDLWSSVSLALIILDNNLWIYIFTFFHREWKKRQLLMESKCNFRSDGNQLSFPIIDHRR